MCFLIILTFNILKNKRYRFKFLFEFYVNWCKLLEKTDINTIILLIYEIFAFKVIVKIMRM
jgi:hypothetical protein